MSEKRPETTADIVSRSTPLSRAQVVRGRRKGRYSVDLSSHMAECDANFHKLMRLFPQLREQAELQIGLHLNDPAKDAGVDFEVIEKGPYTTLLRVRISTAGQWMSLAAAPDMTVRIYHDAQSAEVVSYQNQNRFHGVYEYPNSRMRQRDEKVQLNRFLGEFLTVCLEHGVSRQPISF
ncbi:MAG: DUF1249 domain-containing protein [Pseudomonadota bacterium]